MANQDLTELQDNVLDLEACSHKHKIKIIGIQEGVEEGTEFSRLIPELLG